MHLHFNSYTSYDIFSESFSTRCHVYIARFLFKPRYRLPGVAPTCPRPLLVGFLRLPVVRFSFLNPSVLQTVFCQIGFVSNLFKLIVFFVANKSIDHGTIFSSQYGPAMPHQPAVYSVAPSFASATTRPSRRVTASPPAPPSVRFFFCDVQN